MQSPVWCIFSFTKSAVFRYTPNEVDARLVQSIMTGKATLQ